MYLFWIKMNLYLQRLLNNLLQYLFRKLRLSCLCTCIGVGVSTRMQPTYPTL